MTTDLEKQLRKELEELRLKVSRKQQELNSYLEELEDENSRTLSCKYKQSFLNDITLFNDISLQIKSGLELNTPHYKIYFKTHLETFWIAEVTDKHTLKQFSLWLSKSEVEIVADAISEILFNIVDYELHHNFKGIG